VIIFSPPSLQGSSRDSAEALRALGTNAALYLAHEIVGRERSWAPAYRKIHDKLPKPLQGIVPDPPIPQMLVRRQASGALRILGSNDVVAVPLLRDSFVAADPDTRTVIIDALRYLPYRGADFDSVLEELARRGELLAAVDFIDYLRLRTPRACIVLGQALVNDLSQDQARPPRPTPLLSQKAMTTQGFPSRYGTGDLSLKERALRRLTYMGPNSALAVPAIITALTNADKELRYSAASALAEIGPAARAATPALTRLTNDVSELVQRAAARALVAIGSQADEHRDADQ